MKNMTINEYMEYITVANDAPMFLTFTRQPAIPSILSLSDEIVKQDEIAWYVSKDECIKELQLLLKNHATTFTDVIIEAKQNQPDINDLSDSDIAKYYITRQSRRGSGNLVLDDEFIVYTNVNNKTVDGPFMIVMNGESYGIATNDGLNGISGYIVNMMI